MIVSRRGFSAAAAATGLLTAGSARAAVLGNPDNPAQGPGAVKSNPKSGSDPGPRNEMLGGQLPSSEMPSSTDHGDVENFWLPFDAANRRVQDGGWSAAPAASAFLRPARAPAPGIFAPAMSATSHARWDNISRTPATPT